MTADSYAICYFQPDHSQISIFMNPKVCFNRFLAFLLFFIGFILPSDLSFGQSFKDSVYSYATRQQFAKAAEFIKPWIESVKERTGENSGEYGSSLSFSGVVLCRTGKKAEGEELVLKGLETCRKNLPAGHPDFGAVWFNTGYYFFLSGNYPSSQQYLFQSFENREKNLPPLHPDLIKTANLLATAYMLEADYFKAKKFYEITLEMQEKVLGGSDTEVGNTCINLGAANVRIGNFSQAERYYLKAQDIIKKNNNEEHINTANLYNNIGGLNLDLGNYKRAELYLSKAFALRTKLLKPGDPQISASLLNLANVYDNLGKNDLANEYHQKLLALTKKDNGDEHELVGLCLLNLGTVQIKSGAFKAGLNSEQKAYNILLKAYGPDYADLGKVLNNLGDAWLNKGEFRKAEEYYVQSVRHHERILGKDHPMTGVSLGLLGSAYFDEKKMDKAEAFFLRSIRNLDRQITRYFHYLSEIEKEKFIEKNRYEFTQFESFSVHRYKANPMIAGLLYDEQLKMKGILVNASKKLKERVRNTGDSLLLKRFDEWEMMRTTIARLSSSSDSGEIADRKNMEMEAEKLEKELSVESENFASLADRRAVGWKDVQKKLNPGEVAIEMVRVFKHGIQRVVTDTSDVRKPVYKVKGLTDTIWYAALLVKPGLQHPELVLLKNGNELEEKSVQLYKNCISRKLPDAYSYNQFWKTIDKKLGPGVKRIFFSPDGVYNSINLNTLLNPVTGKYLLEERDIRLLTNTREIAAVQRPVSDEAYAFLVGYPDYNIGKEKRAEIVRRSRNIEPDDYNLNVSRSQPFSELPGTKKEIEQIARLMQDRGWKTESCLEDKALEETVKDLRKPKVLHIATHGFFDPDTVHDSNPLLHSGLLLTGANKTIGGEKDDKMEDGILTAFEAMNLHLDNTDLVVLSACETGLGEIKNGEGVYGLQRAFQVAGAKSIIMSLWKVDDEATQELMVRFYKNWLSPAIPKGGANTTGGLRSAFLAAQKELKAKYRDPYYWGAFVMVGE